MANFTARTTSPVGQYKPEYMSNLYGASWVDHWNTSIYGRPTQAGADVLSNCVGYAQGRMLEIYREITGYNPAQTGTHPFIALNVDAGLWYNKAQEIGLQVQSQPQEGSVLVTPSHVAVVEDYDANSGLYWITESGYDDTTPWYRQQSLYSVGGVWYDSYASSPQVIGFIVIPSVAPGPGPGPSYNEGYNRRRRYRNI